MKIADFKEKVPNTPTGKPRIPCWVFFSVLLLLFARCSRNEDYPNVVYPPDGITFPNPDFILELKKFSFDQTEPLVLGKIEVSKTSAKLQFSVTLTGETEDLNPNLDIRFKNSSGRVVTGGSGGLQPQIANQLERLGYVSFLGPASPGKYTLEVRLLNIPPELPGTQKQPGWQVIGTADCVVHKSQKSGQTE